MIGSQGQANAALGQLTSLTDRMSESLQNLSKASEVLEVLASRIEGNMPKAISGGESAQPHMPSLQNLSASINDKSTWLLQEINRLQALL